MFNMLKGSTKIVNSMTPGAGVLMLGRGHISHYNDYIIIQHINRYCIKGLWCSFPKPLLIFIYSMIWGC